MRMKNKNSFSFLILLLTLSFVIFFGCSLPAWIGIFNEGFDDISLEYDNSIKLPILRRDVLLDAFFNERPIANYITNISSIMQWPVATDATFDYDQIGIVSQVETTTDFDPADGTPDFVIEGFRSTNATLELRIWLTNNSDVTLDIDPADVTVNSLKVEGVYYTFGSGTKDNNVLVYVSGNFLDPAEDYYLDLKGDPSQDGTRLDVEEFLIRLNSSATPTHTADVPYTLRMALDFDFGSNYEVVGTIINEAVVYQEVQPISDMFEAFSAVENFKFDFIFNNDLPMDLSIDLIFTGTDRTPDPSLKSTKVISGQLVQNAMHGYWYSNLPRETKTVFGFAHDVKSYGKLDMDVKFIIISSPDKLRLSTTGVLEIDMNITGLVTIKPL